MGTNRGRCIVWCSHKKSSSCLQQPRVNMYNQDNHRGPAQEQGNVFMILLQKTTTSQAVLVRSTCWIISWFYFTVWESSSLRNLWHLFMRTLMASVTRTSGGRTPVDSTVTGRKRSIKIPIWHTFSVCCDSLKILLPEVRHICPDQSQQAKIQQTDVKLVQTDLTKHELLDNQSDKTLVNADKLFFDTILIF